MTHATSLDHPAAFLMGLFKTSALLLTALGLIILSEIVMNPPLLAGRLDMEPEMAGSWTGHARVFVVWCRQKDLPVTLTIHDAAAVEGTIGDAVLKNGRLRPNRSWLGRALRIRTDYAIVGDLSGPIVAAEGITRRHVSIPLQWDGRRFTGAVITSGTHIGGKGSMQLTAGRLVLSKEEKAVR